MIPNQLLFILIGALFSAVSTLLLSTYQEYKQSVRTRRVLFGEMESMKTLLNSLVEEHEDTRPIRIQIEHQISTKMYEQHLPNLGRLTDDEIAAVMSFYRRMNFILDSYQTYNQMRKLKTPKDREKRKEQSRQEWFSSYTVYETAQRALVDLRAAQETRENITFWEYLRRSILF